MRKYGQKKKKRRRRRASMVEEEENICESQVKVGKLKGLRKLNSIDQMILNGKDIEQKRRK